MNEEAIVAVFDTAEHADAAVRDLEAAHVPSSAISRESSAGSMSGSMTGTSTGMARQSREPGFWESLFGGEPDHDTAVYERSVASGSHVVTVRVPGDHVQAVTDILERHHPVDLDERAQSYGLGATGATTAKATTAGAGLAGAATAAAGSVATGLRDTGVEGGDENLQLAEERLAISKRLVNHGTTRIRRFVVETPVEENVTLHSERVSVERRPVSGDAKATDASFTDKVIEVNETAEEAIVGKTARVREEVVVRKDATDRVETVRDTVRREDVEITKDGTVDTSTRGPAGTVPPVRP